MITIIEIYVQDSNESASDFADRLTGLINAKADILVSNIMLSIQFTSASDGRQTANIQFQAAE